MKYNKQSLLLFFFLILSMFCNGQRQRINIGIGVYGGFTSFGISTDNFESSNGIGWLAGMAATVDIPNKWYNLSYNIQLSESSMRVAGQQALGQPSEDLDFNLFIAQIALIGHLKLIGSNLTLDAGPMLQYNSNLELQDETKSSYFLDAQGVLTANNISDISRFNVNGTIGLSAGIDFVKVRAQYIYGFTNILNRLNDNNQIQGIDFKGNQNMLVLSVMCVF